MNRRRIAVVAVTVVLVFCLLYAAKAIAAELVKAKDGSGVVGYKDTPVLPWCGYHVHDPDRPKPAKVTPGRGASPPMRSFFDGTDLSQRPRLEGRGWRLVVVTGA